MPELAILIIYIGNIKVTLRCLESLRHSLKGVNSEVELIQNGPSLTGGSCDFEDLSTEEFKINHIHFPYNIGLVKTRVVLNEMAVRSGAKYVLFSDNDLLFGEGWYQHTLQAMMSGGFDMIGCGGAASIDFRRGREWFNYYQKVNVNPFKAVPTDSSGLALLKSEILLAGVEIDHSWVRNIGFDDIESFGGGQDDMDFAFQARLRGFKLGGIESPIIHLGSTDRYTVVKESVKLIRQHATIARYFYNKYKDTEVAKTSYSR